MKRKEINELTNTGTAIAVCDPYKYKINPLAAKQGVLVDEVHQDDKGTWRVWVQLDQHEEMEAVTLTEVRCLWSDHLQRIPEFEEQARQKEEVGEAEMARRTEQLERIQDQLELLGITTNGSAKTGRVTLTFDQIQDLLEIAFPAVEESAA